MEGAENGAVAAACPQLRKMGQDLFPGDLTQPFAVKEGGHRTHLGGDGGIICREVRVAGAGIQDAQGVAEGFKVTADAVGLGIQSIGEVDGSDAAQCAGRLVHQSAGLAKVAVFRLLADLCDVQGVQLSAAGESVENHAHQNLIGGGGG